MAQSVFDSEDVRADIIAGLYYGYHINEILAKMGVHPAEYQQYKRTNANFRDEVAEAYNYKAGVMVDKLERIHEEIECPQMASVISSNIKFVASRRNRQEFGDNLQVEVNQTIDIKGTLEQATKRALTFEDGELIEMDTNPLD